MTTKMTTTCLSTRIQSNIWATINCQLSKVWWNPQSTINTRVRACMGTIWRSSFRKMKKTNLIRRLRRTKINLQLVWRRNLRLQWRLAPIRSRRRRYRWTRLRSRRLSLLLTRAIETISVSTRLWKNVRVVLREIDSTINRRLKRNFLTACLTKIRNSPGGSTSHKSPTLKSLRKEQKKQGKSSWTWSATWPIKLIEMER